MVINHKEVNIRFLINTRLKTLHIRVNAKGEVEVRCFEEISDKELNQMVEKNINFIERQLSALERANLPTFKHESIVSILGQEYKIYRSIEVPNIQLKNHTLWIPKRYSLLKIEGYLAYILLDTVKTLTYFYIQKYHFEYMQVCLVNSNKFWGRCCYKNSVKDKIEYNLALVFLPFELVEYVVVHELCHTRRMGHDKNFWAEVEKIIPNAKKIDKKLNDYNLDWYLERLGIERGGYF